MLDIFIYITALLTMHLLHMITTNNAFIRFFFYITAHQLETNTGVKSMNKV